ncbi:protease complex subunit PrcB family protein [Massilia sp. IC2-477]|uniref:protease complex subunit PrcB family protein n=1 Tax=Massilia sp. IC2-477 TaxID=2887198 RepID=UPI001D112059|nr:protease complex subunit PrcB family protein [Massilia sp. IC2-477]MCC2954578.1 protease complex subunit PrcB family protein [Massilia sp. IC2-477]
MSMVGRTVVTAAVVGMTLAACGGGGDDTAVMKNQQAGQGIAVGEPNGGVPVVSEYIKMAQEADCASTRNNLYVVDSKYVVSDRADYGCYDASWSVSLMGPTPQAVLCTSSDSFAGPRTSCSDESLRPLFDTISKNLDKADLGLGAAHKVERVSFLPKSGSPVAFKTVVSDAFSNIETPREVVIKDAAAWSALWAEHSKTRIAAPQFDFTNNMLVAVFAGNGKIDCGTFDVVYVGAKDGKLLVEYEYRDMSPVATCLAVVTQPMRVVAVPKVDVPVEFRRINSPYFNLETIGREVRTNLHTQRNVVVRDEAAWAALWAEHAGAGVALPKVDFSQKMVIGVFRGPKPNLCYGGGIASVGFQDGKLKVGITDIEPGSGAVCGQAIVYPAHLVVVNRSEAPVEFVSEIRSR